VHPCKSRLRDAVEGSRSCACRLPHLRVERPIGSSGARSVATPSVSGRCRRGFASVLPVVLARRSASSIRRSGTPRTDLVR
jgi:hypothetical protein